MIIKCTYIGNKIPNFLSEQDPEYRRRYYPWGYYYYYYSYYYPYYDYHDEDYTLFEPGSGPIWLGHVQCDGTEDRLLDCDYRNDTYSSHEYDVGFSCTPC